MSSLKGKNWLPLGANSFLSEQTLFQKESGMQESKQEVTKVVSLVKNGRKKTDESSALKLGKKLSSADFELVLKIHVLQYPFRKTGLIVTVKQDRKTDITACKNKQARRRAFVSRLGAKAGCQDITAFF